MKYSCPVRTWSKWLCIGLLAVMCVACSDNADRQDTAMVKAKIAQDSLKNILCSAPNGWLMRYFPDVNENLNRDITENYKVGEYDITDIYLMRRMGVGGYNLFLKFNPDGTMRVLTDIAYGATDVATSYTPKYEPEIQDGQYGVAVSEGLNLYFKTSTMIQQLYPQHVNATNHFSPVSISPQKIVLRTNNYTDGHREIIELTPMDVPETAWKSKMEKIIAQKESFRTRGYENVRSNTADARNCVLQIRLASTKHVIYQTTNDVGQAMMTYRRSASYSQDPITDRKVARYDRLQYELFLKNEQPERTSEGHDGSTYYTGLGSGYIATTDGIEFLPGFKYSDQVNFTKFVHTPGKKEWISQNGVYEAVITFVDKQE